MRLLSSATCSRQRATASPLPLMRTEVKIASQSLSIASCSGRAGKTFFAQLGMGTDATHQGFTFAIIAS